MHWRNCVRTWLREGSRDEIWGVGLLYSAMEMFCAVSNSSVSILAVQSVRCRGIGEVLSTL
jgi:hypothetical protein